MHRDSGKLEKMPKRTYTRDVHDNKTLRAQSNKVTFKPGAIRVTGKQVKWRGGNQGSSRAENIIGATAESPRLSTATIKHQTHTYTSVSSAIACQGETPVTKEKPANSGHFRMGATALRSHGT